MLVHVQSESRPMRRLRTASGEN